MGTVPGKIYNFSPGFSRASENSLDTIRTAAIVLYMYIHSRSSFAETHLQPPSLYSLSFCSHVQSSGVVKNLSDWMCTFSAKIGQSKFCLVFVLIRSTGGLFLVYLVPLFCICIFVPFFLFMMILLFKMSPKFIIEVLPDIPKGKKLALCLTEKTRLLDKLCLGMS